MLDEETKNEIFSYVEMAVEDENFFEYKIEIQILGNSAICNDDHSLARAHITGQDQNGFNLCLDLLIKFSPKIKNKDNPIRISYRKEMFLHNTVNLKIYKYWLKKDKIVRDFINPCPIIYKTFSTEEREVLIFNALKQQGYSPNRSKLIPQSLKYIIMKTLAKFHAMSLTFRDQRPEEFEELMKEWQPNTKELLKYINIEQKMKFGLKIAMDILIDENRNDFKTKLEKDIGQGPLAVIEKVFSNVPDEHVIIHGDSWINNIMVNNKRADVKFIFWELATYHSPVLDLAYFLYFTHSGETNDFFENYVEYYYMEFYKYILLTGSDPQKIFPFKTLLEHFLKYSSYALLMALGGLPFIMVNRYLDEDKCVSENCKHCEICENCDGHQSCERCVNLCESLSYADLTETLRHEIREKIIGILELHYKYFGEG